MVLTPAIAQVKQNGLLWQITGNGLQKPSYVYGTMHVSQKIAFHLGDSFFIALSSCDMVALEQDLDSVIHKWISESEYENPDDAEKVYPRNFVEFLYLSNFTLSSYDRNLIKRKLSAEVREVNYLLKRGDQDDFEEDAWLDLYIYQIAKKLGKGFTGVEGYEESRDLVKMANKEPKDAYKKKPKRFNYKLRMQVSEAYRKGDIQLIDSIDRMTESEHYLEYMLYKRNANMVRRIDSIIRQGKTLFTGVGCSHLPGKKGVLQMLIDMGYTVRPVQSIAIEKSKMAKQFETMTFKHEYKNYTSDDGLISANLPSRLTKVNENSYYSSYLSPDLANGYYYQIEKITCNAIFSGKTAQDILDVIDTLIFENLPGEISSKEEIVSNGLNGIEVVTILKTGDLNRFQILASPFNLYIIRMSGKKAFATSSEADNFFKSININEGNAGTWKRINSPDSVFSIELPTNEKLDKLPLTFKANPSFEHLIYEKNSGNIYLIKQEDILNLGYLEQDTFELDVMAKSFSKTDNYRIINKKHFNWMGYNASDVEYRSKTDEKLIARFVICGTRYIMFLMKPENPENDFNDRFFTSIKFNGKPHYDFFEYNDSNMLFKVMTPVNPLQIKQYSFQMYYDSEDENEKKSKYDGSYDQLYFKTNNSNEFIQVMTMKSGYYDPSYSDAIEEFSAREEKSYMITRTYSKVVNGLKYKFGIMTDTNTTRQIRTLSVYKGNSFVSIVAFLDSVSGRSEFVDKFMSTFEITDPTFGSDTQKLKGKRFFEDFTSNDSTRRKASIDNFNRLSFHRSDLKDIFNVIDTINMKGDAASLRSNFITKLGYIDSASDIIVPYLKKLYDRFSDTAYMQIEILGAIAHQQSEKAFKTIKPILSNDIPISNNAYSMTNMLEQFDDSLELTKIILPELIALTSIPEYRQTAYDLISRMKDSGIINEKDYKSIHDKLVFETKIEYKRLMASLTSEKQETEYNFWDGMYNIGREMSTNNTSYIDMPIPIESPNYGYAQNYKKTGVLTNLLDLTLPLKSKNAIMQELVEKILKITDNDSRLELLPVLTKYNLDFHDSVYQSLASNLKTRKTLYNVLASLNHLEKYPKHLLNHKSYIVTDIHSFIDTEEDKVDSVVFISTRKIVFGKDSGLVYICKFKTELEGQWQYYLSESLPMDTNKLNSPLETVSLFYPRTLPTYDESLVNNKIDMIFFSNLIRLTRKNNCGFSYFFENDYSMMEEYDDMGIFDYDY